MRLPNTIPKKQHTAKQILKTPLYIPDNQWTAAPPQPKQPVPKSLTAPQALTNPTLTASKTSAVFKTDKKGSTIIPPT